MMAFSALLPARHSFIFLSLFSLSSFTVKAQHPFPFTSEPLTEQTDFSVKMVAGVDRFLTGETSRIQKERAGLWNRDFSSVPAFQQSIASEYKLLAARVGLAEDRVAPQLQILTNLHARGLKTFKIELAGCSISAIRWQVLDGLCAEGLLLQSLIHIPSPRDRQKSR